MAASKNVIGAGDLGEKGSLGQERRRALVEAAYATIAELGFEGLRTREVSNRVGVNIATLHYYFSSKEELVQAVVDYLIQQFYTQGVPAEELARFSPVERLRLELANLKYRLEHRPYIHIVLNELILRSLRDPAIKQIVQNFDTQWQYGLEEMFRHGVAEGQFRANLNPSAAAGAFLAAIKGMTQKYLTHPTEFNFDEVAQEIERGFIA